MSRTLERIGIALVAILLLVGILWLRSCQRERAAKAEAKIATGQAGAAIQSGTDAVQTIGNSNSAETAIRSTAEEGTHAIENAPAGDSNDVADRATCRMRTYRNSAKCIALLGPVAE